MAGAVAALFFCFFGKADGLPGVFALWLIRGGWKKKLTKK